MNKTFALLISLLIFYGVGGGSLFSIVLYITNSIFLSAIVYLIYVVISMVALVELAGT